MPPPSIRQDELSVQWPSQAVPVSVFIAPPTTERLMVNALEGDELADVAMRQDYLDTIAGMAATRGVNVQMSPISNKYPANC